MTEYNKNNPFSSKILERAVLNKKGSTKRTFHVRLDLMGSSIEYSPGDSIAIFPDNDPILIDRALDLLQSDGQEIIDVPRYQTQFPLKYLLEKRVNLSRVSNTFLKRLLEHAQGDEKKRLEELLHEDNKEERLGYLSSSDLLDVLHDFKNVQFPLSALGTHLSPLLPRFYSIASSPSVDPNAVDLLIATFSTFHKNEERHGVGSHFLCERADLETTPIPLYLQKTPHFKLPENPATDMIMIGPGTGVAPYRAFLQEREEKKASGRNWLFFGERQAECDFYYEDYFSKLSTQGILRLNTAFSRDQKERIYVQHRMQENASDLFAWIEGGAHIYVCGDSKRMAKDVNTTLTEIVAQEGGMSEEEAKAYVKILRTEKRYLLDVY